MYALASSFRPFTLVAVASAAAALVGCASTQLDAQWTDPQLAGGNPLRGARVLIVCEAQDQVLRRICQDELGTQVLAAGATPVPAPDVPVAPGGTGQYIGPARTANAKAVLVSSLTQDATVARPGPSVGVGLGGVGGGGFGGGFGVSVPIGGARVSTGYAANGSITDVASGRLIWTARASTAPSQDLNAQVADLAKSVVEGAKKAGLF